MAGGEKSVESKAEAEALIPLFELERILNQDQSGRRITLLGNIKAKPALLTLERAAFPSDSITINKFLTRLSNTANLGANDVYRWYMSNHSAPSTSSATSGSLTPPDLKLNLIYPCTATHVRKYTAQKLRYVTETPEIYREHIRPWVEQTQRTPARLDWIYNILDGTTEQEDVVFRSAGFGEEVNGEVERKEEDKEGFILLPDLNWDRKTVSGLHLLALVERRDVWSLRNLRKRDTKWLRRLRETAIGEAARYGSQLGEANGGGEVVDTDMLKCYVHCEFIFEDGFDPNRKSHADPGNELIPAADQPTYYHFHIHIVHVMLEAEGTTQSVGKAFSLENLISQLEHMDGKDSENGEASMAQIDMSYFVGEESDIWKKCFARLKSGEQVDLNA